tara:strand:- start:118 stop:360 length:243 start_codon:yes stop_codon:yes gene_type:complete
MSKTTDHIIENDITWEDTNESQRKIDAPKYNSAGFLEDHEKDQHKYHESSYKNHKYKGWYYYHADKTFYRWNDLMEKTNK